MDVNLNIPEKKLVILNPLLLQALWIGCAALAYFAAHYIGFLFPDTQNMLAVIWVAGGIGLASLLLSPRRLWPILLAAFFIAGNTANLLIGRPLFNSVGFMTANIIESLACAWFLCRYRDRDIRFDCIKDVVALIIAATVLNFFSSLFGAVTAALSGSAPFFHFLRSWWISDGLGILLVTPLIITWRSLPEIKLLPALELGCFLIIWCMAAFLAFNRENYQVFSPFSAYIPVVLITWPALRFGQRIVILALLILGIIAVTSKAVTVGPLVWGGITLVDRLLSVQIYLALTSVAGMLLAASHAEAKAAKDLALEQHASLRSIGDNLPDGMIYQVVREPDGKRRFLYLSAGLNKLRGVSLEDVANEPLLLYQQVVEEDRPRVTAAENASAESMTVLHLTIRIRMPGGQIRWRQLSSMPRRLADGRIIWDGIETDITDRRAAEIALRESEEKHRLFFENAGDVIFIHDSEAQILAANPMACQLLGYTHAELLSMTVGQIDSPEEALKIQDRMARLLEQGHLIFETHHRHKSGSLIPIEVNVRLITWEGKPAVMSICRDITERKQAEAALIEYSQRLQLATDSGKFAVWDWNVKDNSMFWDDRMFELYGISCDTFPSNVDAWTNGLHPDDRQRALAENNAALLGEKEFDTTFRVLHPDGAVKYLKANALVIRDQSGKAIRMIGINSDITEQIKSEAERKRLEAQLNQAQKMEAIGTLAGGIAHDFNNILGAIIGYAELAEEDCPAGSIVKNDVEQVLKAGHRAKDLVKQILAFSRQEIAKHSPVQPAVIAKEAIKMLRSSLPTTIDIRQDIDPGAGSVLADPVQIHQILMNLCTNAFHALEETGGILSISLKKKSLSPADFPTESHIQPGDFVRLSVADTGTGISSEIREKIFDPYFTTKEVGKGTGMGLAIIHGIVKTYGGFVTCDSQPGQGSVFQVFLPVLADNAQPEAQNSDPIPFGNEHILFVDDEDILADMGKHLLERLGYRVSVRHNSIDALTTFQNEPDQFDLVITDQTMPGMTGFDLARRMLQIRPDLPIILCTGYSSQISEEKAISYGIKGFAMKPLAKKDIAVLIRKVLDEGSALKNSKAESTTPMPLIS